jgi:hypothetical protein
VDFDAKHPNDAALADPYSHWWPEWHEYIVAADGVPEFGRRVLLTHRSKPNLDKFALYYDNVDLASNSRLLGPFDFDQTLTRGRQVIKMEIWPSVCNLCMGRGILPTTMNTRTRERGITSYVFQAAKKRKVTKTHDNDYKMPFPEGAKNMKLTPTRTP